MGVPLVMQTISNSVVVHGKLSTQRYNSFQAGEILHRKCGRCFKIERENFVGKIVIVTQLPGNRISSEAGPVIRTTNKNKNIFGNKLMYG